jgi:hypothetical protein
MDSNVSPAAPASSNAWMPATGGILSIIVGAMDLIASLFTGFLACAGTAFWRELVGPRLVGLGCFAAHSVRVFGALAGSRRNSGRYRWRASH